LNLKGDYAGNWVGFFDFHCVNAGGAWAFAETRMQSGELFARALGQNFYCAVWIVADPAGDLEDVGFALDEPTEADSLDAAAHYEPASLECGLFRHHALVSGLHQENAP
jgi:hypothetical protein